MKPPTQNSSKTKLLVCNKLYYPWIGGIETFVQQIAEGLDPDEFDIEVLVCQSRGIGRVDHVNGIQITRTSSLGMLFGMPLSPTYIYQYIRKAMSADSVLLNTPFPLGVLSAVVSRSLSKTVVMYHSDIVRQRNFLKIYKPLLNFALKRANKIVVSNPILPRYSNILSKMHNIEVIPFGIDTGKYALTKPTMSLLDTLKARYQKQVVLFIGRLIYYKGLQHLIEAMHEIDAHCIIIGDGPDKEMLLDKARKLRILDKITILPSKHKRDLIPYYHLAHAFVLPSTHTSEAFGLVQLEAMASGTPVINTRLTTGVPWVSRHGESGLTVSPGSSAELAGAIEQLLSDGEKHYKLSTGAFRRALDMFSLDSMITKYSVLLKKN